eukprot:scaffold266600_cov40-Tisochrysis_lutea.AAC.1
MEAGNRAAIARAGAIEPLKSLLSDGTPSGRNHAAWLLRVLANISRDPEGSPFHGAGTSVLCSSPCRILPKRPPLV